VINSQKKIPGDQFEAVKSPFTLVKGYTQTNPTCNGSGGLGSFLNLWVCFVVCVFVINI
jgi:hypothetical protein